MTDESPDTGTVSAAIEAVDAAHPEVTLPGNSPVKPPRDPLALFLVRAAAALEQSAKFAERTADAAEASAKALERIADRLDTILMADGDASGRVIDATSGDGVDGDLIEQLAAEAVEPR